MKLERVSPVTSVRGGEVGVVCVIPNSREGQGDRTHLLSKNRRRSAISGRWSFGVGEKG